MLSVNIAIDILFVLIRFDPRKSAAEINPLGGPEKE
jgi:hypothetical protein